MRPNYAAAKRRPSITISYHREIGTRPLNPPCFGHKQVGIKLQIWLDDDDNNACVGRVARIFKTVDLEERS